ncbi:MAG: hypothetical protein IKI13_09060 [Bacteroidales bacterium]|nr:hypothetical protein [Bacteroidales bacterium]
MRKARKYIIPIVTLLVGFASFSGLIGLLNTELLTGWMKPGVGGTWIWLAVAFALMCFMFVTTVVSGRIKANEAVMKFLRNLAFGGICILIAWLASLLSGKIVETKMSELLFLAVFLLAVFVIGVQYMVGSAKAAKIASANSLRKTAAGAGVIRYDYASLFGAAMFSALLLIAGLILKVDVKPLLVIFSATALALILWRLTGWRGWLMVSVAFATAILCCKVDDMEYSLKQLPYIIALTCAVIGLMAPCADLYGRSEQNL